jgi:predicted SprT family Zn-dependent metalloprotease
MNPDEIAKCARMMLDANGLPHWSFRFNSNKRRRGVCKYIPKRIEMSKYMLSQGEKDIKSLIAHEVAHAVVGVQHGHNNVWRSKAIELGSDGQRLAEPMKGVQFKWKATCSSCGHVAYKNRVSRRTRPSSCGKCSGGRFNLLYFMQYVPNR